MFASLLCKRMELVQKECLSIEEQLESERHEGLKSAKAKKREVRRKKVRKKKKTEVLDSVWDFLMLGLAY